MSNSEDESGEAGRLMGIDVILPAGGRISGELAEETGVEVKALIPVCGQTVLERTLDILRATGRVDRAVVVGPDEIAKHPAAKLADAVLPEGGSTGPANIMQGIEWLKGSESGNRVLMITTDLPFITPQAISTFLDSCPTSVNEYVRLRDGEWTMGCSYLVNPEALVRNRDHIERVFAARKSQIAMVRLLGIMFILRFITRTLAIPHIERRCVQMLGCSGAGIRESPPELAFDIDDIEEYRYAKEHCR